MLFPPYSSSSSLSIHLLLSSARVFSLSSSTSLSIRLFFNLHAVSLSSLSFSFFCSCGRLHTLVVCMNFRTTVIGFLYTNTCFTVTAVLFISFLHAAINFRIGPRNVRHSYITWCIFILARELQSQCNCKGVSWIYKGSLGSRVWLSVDGDRGWTGVMDEDEDEPPQGS